MEPHEPSVSQGRGWSSDGCSALVSCVPTRKSGSHLASVHWLLALTKVLAAQVARAARRWATSQLARRAQHARRRGRVKRPTRCGLEGFSRSWLHLRRIFIDSEGRKHFGAGFYRGILGIRRYGGANSGILPRDSPGFLPRIPVDSSRVVGFLGFLGPRCHHTTIHHHEVKHSK